MDQYPTNSRMLSGVNQMLLQERLFQEMQMFSLRAIYLVLLCAAAVVNCSSTLEPASVLCMQVLFKYLIESQIFNNFHKSMSGLP